MSKKGKYSHLTFKEKSGWLQTNDAEKKSIEKYSKEYIHFLNSVKTERETIDFIEKDILKKGYIHLDKVEGNKSTLAGKTIYQTNKNKNIIMAVIGKEPIEKGINIVCGHVDSPRLDLKQSPLYEDSKIAFFKTHYYGGVKKFHWLNIPLAIHGKIIKMDGSVIDVCIGEKDDEPVMIIPDLLPHLSRKIRGKKISEAYPAEKLNIMLGHIPVDENEKEAVKINILHLLNEKYGIVEDDFNSAELEIVPAIKAREAGLDRGFIAGYGQDDRSASYCAYRSILEVKNPARTSVVLLIDKEEIGSEGNSSIQSKFLELFLSELISKLNGSYNEKMLKQCLFNTYGISSDVDVAYDPNYKDVFDVKNTAKIGNGIVLTKYTGSGGKYSANDANAEYVGMIRKLFTDHDVIYQFGTLGKVDEGGGGTIAKFLANYGMEILDAGSPVLGMHSPYEVSSKLDIYNGYKAFKVFFNHLKK
jgi:aspartyl aminopeptidase